MTELRSSRDPADVRKSSGSKRNDNPSSKAPCKELCDRRDMKLKEAEKTIANKDVIIKMLQEHVKKLEESYKHNLKETEDFRYKFCLASEQVKRLRAGSKPKDKRDKEKEIRELRSDLTRWKQQCDELMGAKERCVGLAGRCSNNVQKIKNVEKFMKAHYELLQTLVEKIAEKTSNVQLDTTAIEDTKKLYSDQIRLLQEEIQRLKAENTKLQDQVVVQDLNQFHDAKDSILETIKKNSLEPHKEHDSASQQETPNEVENDDSEGDAKRVSFNTNKSDRIQKESIVSFQLEAEILEEPEIADEKEDTPETEQEAAGTTEEPVNVEAKVENDAPPKHIQLADPMYYCACTPRNIQVQTEETVVSTETNTVRTVNTVSSTQKVADKSQGEGGDVEVMETTVVEDVQSQSVTMVSTTISGPRPKTEVPIESEKQPVVDDMKDTKNDVLDQDISQGESHEVFQVDDKERTDVEGGKGEDTVDEPERPTPDTQSDIDSSKVKPTVEEGETERSSVQNVEDISSEAKRLSNESVGSKERSSVQNAENVSNEPKRLSNESVGSKERSSVQNAVDNSIGEPKRDSGEKLSGNNLENGNNNDAGDVTVKLNEIRDKVIELVQKQSDACKELEMLKTEMSTSRDSTNECTENIAKLKETIEDQKETFVENFKEHKTVTDNLSQVNDKIQQELSELKSKIETLFKNVNDLKNTRREKSNSKLGDSQPVSLDDDLITIEECQYELYKLNKNQEQMGASVGIPTAFTENVTQNNIETDSEKNTVGTDRFSTDSAQADTSVPAEPQLQQPEEDVEKLEKQYTDLKKESKEKDKQIKCINALISYYSKAKKDVMAISPPKAGDENVKCKCGDDEIHNYIEKVRDENHRLKVTISSVIDHLNLKMTEIKGAAEQTTSRFCLCMSGNDTRLENESYQSDASSVCSNCLVPDCQNDPTELQIEDIYKVVCRTYAPSKGARYQDSSSSCLCNKNAKSSYTCFCNGSLPSDQEVNIEDIYKSVLCACGSKVDQTADNLIPCDPSCQSEKLTTDSTQKVTSGCQQECVLETCDKLDKCSGQSLMTNLQTYVNYLHEQLDIISSIENRIEDLRVDIKTPQA